MMAADDDHNPTTATPGDTEIQVTQVPLWRRIPGGVLMTVGALVALVFLVLALVVSFTFVEWRSAFDGLTSVAMVCAPPVLVGSMLAMLGRWIYGGWRTDQPVRRTAAFALPYAGVIAAFGAIAMFVWALVDETGRGGAWLAGQFAISVVLSFALVAGGLALRRRAEQA